MHPDNPIVRLCIEGMRAEGERRIDRARDLFERAWTLATNDFEKCVAAHYVARHQPTPEDTLHWNLESLHFAETVGDESVETFFPSLYLNLGHAYEILGDHEQAGHYFELADGRSRILGDDRYGEVVRDGIKRARERVG